MIYDHQKPSAATLLRITSVFWLCGKLISWRLWTKDRYFPLAPVFNFMANIPGWAHWMLFGAALICLVLLIIRPANRYLLPALIIIEICSCVLDQNRWQPWEYQYLFTVFIIAINRNNYNIARYAFVFLLAATYIYSGLNKIDTSFLYTIWDRMVLTAYLKLPVQIAHNSIVFHSGYCMGLIECIAGAALLFPKSQKASATILVLMHLFNLLLLGPLGLHYNKIVWPWNVAMIAYLYFLFIRKGADPITFAHFYQLRKGYNKIVILCWGILPAFSFVGLWDNYLSSNLYSGRLPLMDICVSDTSSLKQLRPYFSKTDTLHICAGIPHLSIQTWAMKEMNVPPYPEKRIYKKIKEVCIQKYAGAPDEYILFHYTHSGIIETEELK